MVYGLRKTALVSSFFITRGSTHGLNIGRYRPEAAGHNYFLGSMNIGAVRQSRATSARLNFSREQEYPGKNSRFL